MSSRYKAKKMFEMICRENKTDEVNSENRVIEKTLSHTQQVAGLSSVIESLAYFLLGDEQISDSDKCIDSLIDCIDAPELTMTVAMAISDEIPVQTFSSLGDENADGIEITEQILQDENNINVLNLININPQHSLTNGAEETPAEKKSKKRKRVPENWKKNKKKSIRNAGREYETVKGKLVSGKAVKPTCDDKCRLKCSMKINEEQRLNIFTSFWNMGDLSRQRDYVYRCMESYKPKYSLHNENSKRCLNVAYYFTVDSEKIRVCKRFYTATLNIGHSFLTTVSKKADSTGVISADLRGKHIKNGRCLPDDVKKGVLIPVKNLITVGHRLARLI